MEAQNIVEFIYVDESYFNADKYNTFDIKKTTMGYSIELLSSKNNTLQHLTKDISEKDGLKFFSALIDKCKIDLWNKRYENLAVVNKGQWKVIIVLDDSSKLEHSGDNAYPMSWAKFKKMMNKLTGSLKVKF